MPLTGSQDADRVWFRLIRLQARMMAAIGRQLKELGLSIPQCDVLTTLTEREGLSQQELAERLYVTKGNISGLVDRLVTAGLVERRSIEGDRRSHAIYLTAHGRRLALQGIAVQKSYVAETLGRLSGPQVEQFEALLVATRDLVRLQESRHAAPSSPDERRLRVTT